MDALRAAWLGAGAPAAGLRRQRGRCARCSDTDGAGAPAGTVVSGVFTSHDSWHDPTGAWLCAACVWGYRTSRLRLVPHLVTADPPGLDALTFAAVAERLTRGPVAAGSALTVPLRPGRKHLMPAACWGRVTVDDTALAWTVADAARLAATIRLRTAGFTSRQLAQPAPAWPVLRRLTGALRADVATDWEALRPWRTSPPWLNLAVAVTSVTRAGIADAAAS